MVPEGAGYQHTNNIFPSGGRLRVRTQNRPPLHRRRMIRRRAAKPNGRRLPSAPGPLAGYAIGPLYHCAPSTRVLQCKLVGGESSRSLPAAPEVRPGRYLFATTAHQLRGCVFLAAPRYQRMHHREVSRAIVRPGMSPGLSSPSPQLLPEHLSLTFDDNHHASRSVRVGSRASLHQQE